MILLKSLTRILAVVGKELIEVVRRPGAILSLILGPFLIMAIFGVATGGTFFSPRNLSLLSRQMSVTAMASWAPAPARRAKCPRPSARAPRMPRSTWAVSR